jgi:hypothetical protein
VRLPVYETAALPVELLRCGTGTRLLVVPALTCACVLLLAWSPISMFTIKPGANSIALARRPEPDQADTSLARERRAGITRHCERAS